MFKLRRGQLSQVFLCSPELARKLIGRSSIGKSDLVLEIGPGTGLLTSPLLRAAKRVIAIERDPDLHRALQQQFCHYKNLRLVCADFLQFQLPQEPYKVLANIPFAIEGRVIRKLIDAPNPPEDCYLVMRKEVAERLAGITRDGQFSILHKPWFEFEIVHRFERSDFIPKPKVESVMLRFVKRTSPLLPKQERSRFRQFIIIGFGGGRRVRQNLSNIFSPHQLRTLSRELKFSPDAKPSDLSFSQWLSLYRSKDRVCYNSAQ